MSRKTTRAYNTIWEFLKEKFPNFDPKVSMTDFERALQNSIVHCFPGIRICGCHFHYAQVSKCY